MFDQPSGVSSVSAVKNTGEAAALVCAEHISSKSLHSSVAPHLNGFLSAALGAAAPVDTGHFLSKNTLPCLHPSVCRLGG